MPVPSINHEGPLLVFFGGRFIPTEQAKLEFGETTEPIRTASHRPVQGTQVKTAQYQLRFKTRRDPMLRPAGPPVTDALLFSRNKELVLEDPVLKNCIVEKDCYGDFWRVELMGSGAMMNER